MAGFVDFHFFLFSSSFWASRHAVLGRLSIFTFHTSNSALSTKRIFVEVHVFQTASRILKFPINFHFTPNAEYSAKLMLLKNFERRGMLSFNRSAICIVTGFRFSAPLAAGKEWPETLVLLSCAGHGTDVYWTLVGSRERTVHRLVTSLPFEAPPTDRKRFSSSALILEGVNDFHECRFYN